MRPVVMMPDAEAAVVSFLNTQLTARTEPYTDNIKVSTRIPNPIVKPYIQVRRAGGVTTDIVLDHPRIDCLVWHNDDASRMDLAQMTMALLLAIANDTANGVRLYSASDALAPIQVPDPVDPTQTVALLTVEVVVRGAQV